MPQNVQNLILSIDLKDPIDSSIKLQKIRQTSPELSSRSEDLLVKLLADGATIAMQHEVLATLAIKDALSVASLDTVLPLAKSVSTIILYDLFLLIAKCPECKSLSNFKDLWLKDGLSDIRSEYLRFFLFINSPEFINAQEDAAQRRIQINLYYFLSATTPDIQYSVVKYLLEDLDIALAHCALIVPALGEVLLDRLLRVNTASTLTQKIISEWMDQSGDLLDFALELDAKSRR